MVGNRVGWGQSVINEGAQEGGTNGEGIISTGAEEEGVKVDVGIGGDGGEGEAESVQGSSDALSSTSVDENATNTPPDVEETGTATTTTAVVTTSADQAETMMELEEESATGTPIPLTVPDTIDDTPPEPDLPLENQDPENDQTDPSQPDLSYASAEPTHLQPPLPAAGQDHFSDVVEGQDLRPWSAETDGRGVEAGDVDRAFREDGAERNKKLSLSGSMGSVELRGSKGSRVSVRIRDKGKGGGSVGQRTPFR
ncbi:hypothetical protein HK102_006675 [Quaeritorhiza haematococci]|nr:hypothetical protein HK102_006675 [Quaeritorhiza haematococci]